MKTALKSFRESKGLTQEQTARKMNVTLSYYTQVERGAIFASRTFMAKLKLVFPDIPIDEIFFGEKPMLTYREALKMKEEDPTAYADYYGKVTDDDSAD